MIVLISEDLMMSSTVSAAVRAEGFVASVERAKVKLEGNDCELLIVDLQTAELDWESLAGFVSSVPRAVAYAQHVNVDILKRGRELSFESVLTRGQFHAGVSEVIVGPAE